MSHHHAHRALQAYLKAAKNQHLHSAILVRHRHILDELIALLPATPSEHVDHAYRLAVDQLLAHRPPEQQAELIETVRHYYSYWMGEHHPVGHWLSDSQRHILDLAAISGDLLDLFSAFNADSFSQRPHATLNAYIANLAAQGHSEAICDIRERMLGLLLYLIRKLPRTPGVYRAGVDTVLARFNQEESRQAFLLAAREYFYFWCGVHVTHQEPPIL